MPHHEVPKGTSNRRLLPGGLALVIPSKLSLDVGTILEERETLMRRKREKEKREFDALICLKKIVTEIDDFIKMGGYAMR